LSLVIATPCYGNACHSAYLKSIVKFALSAPIDWNYMVPDRNDSLVQRARNVMVRKFLETEYEYLMFIDSDIEFEPDDVAKVWNIEGEIKGGIYPMKHPEKDWYAAWSGGKLIQELGSEVMECDYLGTGFLMVRRTVFERMQDECPELTHAEGEYEDVHAWFNPRVEDTGQGPIYLSEDYEFCHTVREMGYKIYADPTVKLLHHGSYAYGSRETVREG